MQQEFYSNGKLLLSGEYAILDGALGLAIPTKYGQSLSVKSIDKKILQWKSMTHEGNIWFEAEFSMDDFSIQITSDKNVAQTLQNLLIQVKRQNHTFLEDNIGVEAISHLTFPREWGLGSSSTLINNLAQWADVDAYELLWNAFGGSGYDIACAQHDHPITYQLINGTAHAKKASFDPAFGDSLYFVYLNQKQSSKNAIKAYRNQSFDNARLVHDINHITEQMIGADSLESFKNLIEEHETILSRVLGIPPVKQTLFQDYPGTVKSLGAWGGDFVLATGDKGISDYFNSKGFDTILQFSHLALQVQDS